MNTILWQIDTTLIVTICPQDYSTSVITPMATAGLQTIVASFEDVSGTVVHSASGMIPNVLGIISFNTEYSAAFQPSSLYTMIVTALYNDHTSLLTRKQIQTYS